MGRRRGNGAERQLHRAGRLRDSQRILLGCAVVELLIYIAVRNTAILIVVVIFLIGSLVLQLVRNRVP